MKARTTAMLKKLSLALTVVVLSVVLTESIVRWLLPSPGFEASGQAIPGLLVPHPTRSYAYAPGFMGTSGQGDREIDIHINSMGLRDDPIEAGEDIDVLAAGDSFTAGWGVQAEDSWPSVLESTLNSRSGRSHSIRVVNAGVSGYSLEQIRRLIEELLILHPRLVVLGLPPSKWWRIDNPYVYFGGQAVMSSIIPHIEVAEGGYLYSAFDKRSLQRLDFWLMENLHTGAYLLNAVHRMRAAADRDEQSTARPTPTPREDLTSLLEELGRIHELLVHSEVGLVVLLVNQQELDGSFSRLEKQYNSIVKAYCDSTHIAVFDPLPSLETKSGGKPIFRAGEDFHWSRAAHEVVGQELGRLLSLRGLND